MTNFLVDKRKKACYNNKAVRDGRKIIEVLKKKFEKLWEKYLTNRNRSDIMGRLFYGQAIAVLKRVQKTF